MINIKSLKMKETGLKDVDGEMIISGNHVSLDGNITSDDSLGELPNGWTFDESDVYEVFFDEKIKNWSLKLGLDPDTPYNVKYMNHAVSLLHSGRVKITAK